MLAAILKFFELFTKLPKSVQEQIINAVILTLTLGFKRFFKKKKEEDLRKATEEAVSPEKWQTTSVAVSNLMPSLYSQKKKEEFANSVVELIRSDSFIKKLSTRIEKINANDEESYVALCSVEAKKLIIEMMDKIKK
ncbi:hypothetical protein ABK836_16415 [Enterobacter hormaechei]|uniref:hypothetical protein n=1 Tax=Enterobacter hormaechei TaxID=158836 RepID=UPI0005F2168C|nr:hypothetical protein [Enterobacter hormaechei]QLU71431.1 hypothetical protein HV217_08755 [Enterobacter cloacae]QLU91558.1 hypothetical protein HV266_08340 [Enterobacter roggenkampii]DAF10903.1 MAG TPA: hypothetical protein [Caudoviricetes sp.]HED3660518.1 hypothetical protein [Enterobacter hormaechei subsp. hoffmannii]KJQ06008.1 hypothetical protein VE18_23875 [Enterobacter hormaechei]